MDLTFQTRCLHFLRKFRRPHVLSLIKSKLIYLLVGLLKKSSLTSVVAIPEFDLRMKIAFSSQMGRLYFAYRGLYERQDLRFLRDFLSPGATCIDAGASYGLYTLTMAKAVGPSGKIFAFEPARDIYRYLIENIELNALNNVMTSPAALGSYNGTANLYYDKALDSASSLKVADVSNRASRQVNITTLDNFLKAQNVPKVDFIKADIEGAELEFLKGAGDTLKTHHPGILMEINPEALAAFGTDQCEVCDFLNDLGYSKCCDPADNMKPFSKTEKIYGIRSILFTP